MNSKEKNTTHSEYYQIELFLEAYGYIKKHEIKFFEINIRSTVVGNSVCVTFERDFIVSSENYLYSDDVSKVESKLDERFELRKNILKSSLKKS
jgi:hypothetical protein